MSEASKVVGTIVLMIASVAVFAIFSIYYALPVIAITIIFILINFTKVGAISANRKINRFTYNAIREEGLKRIRSGSFHVSEEKFTESMDRIKDLISDRQYFPEFGIDGVFVSYTTEMEANRVLQQIRDRGVKADTVLDRRTWLIKIEFD